MSSVVSRMSSRTSSIWNYFSVENEVDKLAKCSVCTKFISRGKDVKSYGTSALRGHLASLHKKEYAELLNMEDELKKKRKRDDEDSEQKEKKAKPNPQPSLISCLDRLKPLQKDSQRAREITAAIAKMIAIDEQPYSIVQDTGFKLVLEVLEPRYQCPSRKYFTDVALPQLRKEIEEKLREHLTSGFVSMTTDTWTTECTPVSYMAITAHWIDDEWKQQSALLCLRHLPHSHTGENLAEEFTEALTYWNITNERIHVVLRDNARNAVKSMQAAHAQSEGCLAHTLQLAINDGIMKQADVIKLLATGRSLVGHFKRSSTAAASLDDIQLKINVPMHHLIQDTPTRWNSSFYMLERLIEQRRALTVFADENDTAKLTMLTSAQWTLAENVCAILGPFERETRSLCRHMACISDVIPTAYILQKEIDGLKKPNLLSLRKTLLLAMKTRFADYERSSEYSVATLLDARYKTRYFMTQDGVEHGKEKLVDLLRSGVVAATSEESTTGDVEEDDETEDPWKLIESSINTDGKLKVSSCFISVYLLFVTSHKTPTQRFEFTLNYFSNAHVQVSTNVTGQFQ